MRGFGAVQTCFAYESQMDRLAAELGVDPVDLRRRNAMRSGGSLPTGQRVDGPVPVAELLHRVRDMPLPAVPGAPMDLRDLPGGVGNVTHGEGVRRGVGYAVGYKNLAYSEGFDDPATARVRLSVTAGEPLVEVHSAAVRAACQAVRNSLLRLAATKLGRDPTTLALTGGAIVSHPPGQASAAGVGEGLDAATAGFTAALGGEPSDPPGGEVLVGLAELLGATAVEETRTYRHRPTFPLDPETGQNQT